ncbi:hypothetical protein CN151_03745 [Sinorhizobium meliloti]|uniref:Uncharacterized protein n=1 Tax=Rhizobium meliloti TaxID=382 RepID=A0A6A7ZXQ9_RHIML|nr:hypothetical protein SMB554_27950 [Sinorhizobium meliloti]MDW9391102.1 hypothetical protein [Sinorhizobium meliloti]MDX0198521.1 hypothetical protein [Sinorhizobium meliloti]MDX0236280.1 hypothetical protein [Sinorhizobium meliloti]MQW06948.1 hypothetical protein [Sinorhizobium meliloti]
MTSRQTDRGSFGFAVGRSEPNWFCFEHRPEWKSRREVQPRHRPSPASNPATNIPWLVAGSALNCS